MTSDPLDDSAFERILIHKPDHAGDIVLAAPVVDAIRRRFARAHITAALDAGAAPFLDALAPADAYILVGGPWWWRRPGHAARYLARVMRGRFTLVVNLRHDFRDIALLSLVSRRLATFTHRRFGTRAAFAVAPPGPDEPEASNLARVAEALGAVVADNFRAPVDTRALAITDTLPADAPLVAFHPFAGTSAKAWTHDAAAQFASRLTGAGARIVLIGDARHAADAARLAREIPDTTNLVGRTTAAELVAVIRRADALVCTDSAPGHIAPFVGTPAVSLMSGTNVAARWAPAGAIVLTNDVRCAPCGLRACVVAGHPCMTGIDADAVADAALRAMGTAR
ncbi:glycosyltransferase family 9 protein [bacterium]|nr:glycosyltransferase family 9 protein [bacterium]